MSGEERAGEREREWRKSALYEQIRAQPSELRRLLREQAAVEEAAALLRAARRVHTVGVGTSWNAAVAAAYMLRAVGLDATAWNSFDFALYTPRLDKESRVVVFSHSGRKTYSRQVLEMLEGTEVPAVWIGSSEALPAPATIHVPTLPKERSSTHTVSFTTAMFAAALIVERIQAGALGPLSELPGAVEAALDAEADAESLAHAWAERPIVVAVGGGPREVLAHEAAIKLAEAARVPAVGFGLEQFLHGPQTMLQAETPVIVFDGPGAAGERTATVVRAALDLGAAVAVVGAAQPQSAGARWLRTHPVGELLAPIVDVVPLQLFAAALAGARGVNPDVFRLDDPRFASAYEKYSL